MALQHGFYWEFPLNSDQFNRNNEALIAPGVYEGLEIAPSATPMNITIAEGKALIPNGAVVWNVGGFINLIGVDVNSESNPRMDRVVIEYIHGSSPTDNVPRIKVLIGDDSTTPVPPDANSNQISIGTIYLPAGTNDLNDSGVIISNAPRVTELVPGGFVIRPDAVTTIDAIYDSELEALVVGSDIRTETTIPASVMFMSAKLAMEGHYWGNYDVSHSGYVDGQPGLSTINLKDMDEVTVETVNVAYTYDDNGRITERVFTSTDWILTETYTYDPLDEEKLPAIEQVITSA